LGTHTAHRHTGAGQVQTAPLFLNLSTRWRWVVSFTLRSLYP